MGGSRHFIRKSTGVCWPIRRIPPIGRICAVLGSGPFQLVVCNLYPFSDTPDVEQIDIGGVALVRAAAKNHAHLAVVTSPSQYSEVIAAMESGKVDGALRRRLAAEAFAHTAAYDADIARWISPSGGLSDRLVIALRRERMTRYGENPHQQGALYTTGKGGFRGSGARRIQGKAMSYNNYATRRRPGVWLPIWSIWLV